MERFPRQIKVESSALTTPNQFPKNINGMIIFEEKKIIISNTHTHTQIISESTHKKIIRCSYIWRMIPKFPIMGMDCSYYVI